MRLLIYTCWYLKYQVFFMPGCTLAVFWVPLKAVSSSFLNTIAKKPIKWLCATYIIYMSTPTDKPVVSVTHHTPVALVKVETFRHLEPYELSQERKFAFDVFFCPLPWPPTSPSWRSVGIQMSSCPVKFTPLPKVMAQCWEPHHACRLPMAFGKQQVCRSGLAWESVSSWHWRHISSLDPILSSKTTRSFD